MDDLELRLRALEIASLTNPSDVLAAAEGILAFLSPAPGKVASKRKPYSKDLLADVQRAIALIRDGVSRNSAAKAIGYRDSSGLLMAARRLGIDLPPPDITNPRVVAGMRAVSAMHVRRAARFAAAV